MSEPGAAAKTVRVIRAGNGKALVVPSPVNLKRAGQLVVKNWTECLANVSFAGVPIEPKGARIAAGDYAAFSVDSGAAYGYYEYDVQLDCALGERRISQYAEGNSKPGVIIDA